MAKESPIILSAIILSILLSSTGLAERQYKEWLEQEVVWIMSKAERQRFEKLKTDPQRDEFIEQFWKDRDPTPGTAKNEYKEQHYQRLKSATENFKEGIPGWRTDRGRVYIIHGPPVSQNVQADREIWTYNSNPYAEYYKGPISLVFERGAEAFQERLLSDSEEARRRQAQIPGRTPALLGQKPAASLRYRLVNAGPARSGELATSVGETDRYIADLLRSPGEVLEDRRREEERRRTVLEQARQDISVKVAFAGLQMDVSAFIFHRVQEAWVFFALEVPTDQHPTTGESSRIGEQKIDVLLEISETSSGRVVDSLDRTLPVSGEQKETEDRLQARSSVYFSERFRVPPGSYQLLCFARDASSGKAATKTLPIEAATAQAEKLGVSNLVLTPRIDGTGLDTPDAPLSLYGARFLPPARPLLDKMSPLYLYFEIQGPEPAVLKDNFYFDYQIYDKERVYYRSPLRKLETEAKGNVLAAALRLELSQMESREYTLLLKIFHPESRQYALQRLAFTLTGGSTGPQPETGR